MPTETKRADVSQANQTIMDFKPLAEAVESECGNKVTYEAKLRTKSPECQDAVAQAQAKQAQISAALSKVVEGGLYKDDGTIISKLGEVCPDVETPMDPKMSYANKFSKFHQMASECSQRVSILFAEDPTKPAEPMFVLKDLMGHTWESIDTGSKDPNPACGMLAVKSWLKGTDEPADPAPAPAPEPAPAPAPMTGTGEKADALELVPLFTPAELGDELISAMEKRWGEDASSDRNGFSDSLKNADYEASLSALRMLVVSVNATDMKKFEGTIPEITPIKVPEFVEVAGPDGEPVPMKDAEGNNIKVVDLLQNDDDADIKKVFEQARNNTLRNILAYANYLSGEVFNSVKSTELINEFGKTESGQNLSISDDTITMTFKLDSGKAMSALLRDFEKFAKAKREQLMKDKPKPYADTPNDLLASIVTLPEDEAAWMAQVKAQLKSDNGWINRNTAFIVGARRKISDLLNEENPSMFRLRLEELSSVVEAKLDRTVNTQENQHQTQAIKAAMPEGKKISMPPSWDAKKSLRDNLLDFLNYMRYQSYLVSDNNVMSIEAQNARVVELLDKMGYKSEKRKDKDNKPESMNKAEFMDALNAIKDEKDYNKFAAKAREWAEDQSSGPGLSGQFKAAEGSAPGRGSSRKGTSNYSTAAGAEVTRDIGDKGTLTFAIDGSIAGSSGKNIPSVGGITAKKEPKSSGPSLSNLNGTYTSKDYGDAATIAGTAQLGVIEGNVGGNGGAIVKYRRKNDKGEYEDVVATKLTAGYYHQELGNEASINQKVLGVEVTWTPTAGIALVPGATYTFNDPDGGEETEEFGLSFGLKANPKGKGGFAENKISYNSPFGANPHMKLLQTSSFNNYLMGGYRFGGLLDSAYGFIDYSYLGSDSKLGGTTVGGNDTGSSDSATAYGVGVKLAVSKKFSVSPWAGYRTMDINTQHNEGSWNDNGFIFGFGILYTD